jgi:hypothetical protein
MAENKKQVDFEMNAKKKRVRACAEKSLESATESGRVDAERSAPRKLCLVRLATLVSLKDQGAKNGNVTTKSTKGKRKGVRTAL